ncbi:hypothetical protein EDB19DRAFT_1906113 [Suillus lakei]|nr:hypothetical protein EDB19DRAFT_1906113 [Suillus lakei]
MAFLKGNMCLRRERGNRGYHSQILLYCASLSDPPPQIVPFRDGLSEGAYGTEEIEDIIGSGMSSIALRSRTHHRKLYPSEMAFLKGNMCLWERGNRGHHRTLPLHISDPPTASPSPLPIRGRPFRFLTLSRPTVATPFYRLHSTSIPRTPLPISPTLPPPVLRRCLFEDVPFVFLTSSCGYPFYRLHSYFHPQDPLPPFLLPSPGPPLPISPTLPPPILHRCPSKDTPFVSPTLSRPTVATPSTTPFLLPSPVFHSTSICSAPLSHISDPPTASHSNCVLMRYLFLPPSSLEPPSDF